MDFRKSFDPFPIEGEDGLFIYLHHLHDVFHKNRQPTEHFKAYDNVTRTLNGYGKEKTKKVKETINGVIVQRQAIAVMFVIKFIFQNAKSMICCSNLADSIDNYMYTKSADKNKTCDTLFSLYMEVPLTNPAVQTEFSIHDVVVPLLSQSALDYKMHFSNGQWQNILL